MMNFYTHSLRCLAFRRILSAGSVTSIPSEAVSTLHTATGYTSNIITSLINNSLDRSSSLTKGLRFCHSQVESVVSEDKPLTTAASSTTKNIKLFLRGLPYNVSEGDIYRFFGNIQIYSIKIGEALGRPGFRTGEATVVVKEHDEHMALAKNMTYIGKRYIEVSSLGTTTQEPLESPQSHPNNSLSLSLMGLPFSVTEEEIRQFLSDASVKEVKLLTNNYGLPSGRAVVKVESMEDKQKVLLKDREYMGPRYIEISEYVPEYSSHHVIDQDSFHKTVVLRGLPFRVIEEEIHGFLQGVNIKNVTIHENRIGRRTGTASVVVESDDDVTRALEKHMNYLNNRYIEVQRMERQPNMDSEE